MFIGSADAPDFKCAIILTPWVLFPENFYLLNGRYEFNVVTKGTG